MTKYQPLSDHLAGFGEDEWRPTFAELEAVLGFPLPKTARTGRAWWANTTDKPHNRAWLDHGWRIEDVDPTAEQIVFRRTQGSPTIQPPAMRAAAEEASKEMHAKRAAGMAAIVGGVVAVAAIGLKIVRRAKRR